MTRAGRWALVTLTAVAALAVGLYFGRHFTGPTQEAAQTLLQMRFRDAADQPTRLADLSDRVLVVNFWATWCAPCREEMPALSRSRQKFAANGVEFVGIALDTADSVQAFSREVPVSYPIWIAGTELIQVLRRLGNGPGGLPYTIVIDREGKIGASHLGPLSEAEIDALVARFAR